MLDRRVGVMAPFDALSRMGFDNLGKIAECIRAKLPRFAFQRVRGHHHGDCVVFAHCDFKRIDRFRSILTEIA